MSQTRHKVASLSSLTKPLTEVKIGETPVLLARLDNKVYALGSKCSHYGAPLKNGVLSKDGCLVCPWHAAKFHVATGDIEDAPAPKPIASYKVEVQDDDVFVIASEQELKDGVRSVCDVKPPSDSSSVVIVGSGAAGFTTADSLRASGYQGKITMFTTEPNTPLDRTKLSKAYIGDASKLEWFTKDEWTKLKVDIKREEVVSVDKQKKTVTLKSGETVGYSKLVLAVGCAPSKLPIKGADLENIFVLRNIEHVRDINKAVGEDKSKHVLLLGGSFIGMESATALIGKAASVTVIEPAYPLKAVLGEKIAQRLVKLHEEKGVKFVIGQGSVKEFKPSKSNGSALGSALLENGKEIPVDVCIMAVGVKPATQWLSSAFEVQKDGGIDVEQTTLIKGETDIYAVGDISRFKHPGTDSFGRIEHWDVAGNLGRQAGEHIAGKKTEYSKTPFFWTAQQGKQIRYAGHAEKYDDIIYDGSVEDLTFAAYYTQGDKVLAVTTIGKDPIAVKVAELMRLGKMLSPSDLKAGKSPLDVSA